MGSGQLNLSTDLCTLDALCVLHDDRGDEELVSNTEGHPAEQLTAFTIDSRTARVLGGKRRAAHVPDEPLACDLGVLGDEHASLPRKADRRLERPIDGGGFVGGRGTGQRSATEIGSPIDPRNR